MARLIAMALTVNLTQISTVQAPGIGFYSRLRQDSTGQYYDTATSTLLPLPNTTAPNIVFSESPSGSGMWSWTLDLSTLPDGFYTIDSYESTQNTPAANSYHVFLVGGETRESIAATQVAISHNTGGPDTLSYVAPNGAAIAGATVRVYTNADWTAQALQNPLGVTVTDYAGRWTSPVFVPAGNTYVIQFQLPGAYGPDTASVTV